MCDLRFGSITRDACRKLRVTYTCTHPCKQHVAAGRQHGSSTRSNIIFEIRAHIISLCGTSTKYVQYRYTGIDYNINDAYLQQHAVLTQVSANKIE